MNLKIVCQICGNAKVLDTEEPIGSEPRWESYTLGNYGIEHPYDNYEIWICPDCMEFVITRCGIGYDETGEEYPDYEYDGEKLERLIKGSLGIAEKIKREQYGNRSQ